MRYLLAVFVFVFALDVCADPTVNAHTANYAITSGSSTSAVPRSQVTGLESALSWASNSTGSGTSEALTNNESRSLVFNGESNYMSGELVVSRLTSTGQTNVPGSFALSLNGTNLFGFNGTNGYGNGSGFTNIPAAAIVGLAGGSATNAIGNSGGSGTNTTFYGYTRKPRFVLSYVDATNVIVNCALGNRFTLLVTNTAYLTFTNVSDNADVTVAIAQGTNSLYAVAISPDLNVMKTSVAVWGVTNSQSLIVGRPDLSGTNLFVSVDTNSQPPFAYGGLVASTNSVATNSVAMDVWYVDPSASTSTEDGTTANPYKSLNAALAGKCNKTFTNSIQIRCRTSGSVADTTRVNTEGLVLMLPSSSNYLQIIAETGHRAGASWDASKYNLYPAWSAQDGTAMKLTQPYIHVDGLQIGISSQTNTAEIVYWAGGTGTPAAKISNCIIRGRNDASNLTRGLSTQSIQAWNCIIYAIGTVAGSVAVQTHSQVTLYSCTMFSGGIIVVNSSGAGGAIVAKNCYAGGSSYQAWNADSGSTLTQTTCAASDTTGTAGLDNVAVNTTNFTNVTAGSEDYHIPTGSALKNVGTDTSGDAAPFNFTTDIDGATRSGTWDVGADEF